MNGRAQLTTFFVTLMVGITIIIVALALAPTIQQVISTSAANSTSTNLGLNCTGTNPTTYTKATCMISDISLPAFIGTLIFVGGGVIGAKLLLQQ